MGNQSPRRGVLRTLGTLVAAVGLTAVGLVALQVPSAGPGGNAVANAEWCVDENGERYWALDCGDGGGDEEPGPGDDGNPGPGDPNPWPKSETRTMPDCNRYPDGAIYGEGEPGFQQCLDEHVACLEEDPNDDGVGEDNGEPGGGYSNDEFLAHFTRTMSGPGAPWSAWLYSGSSCGETEPPPSPEEISERFRTDLPVGEPNFQPTNRTIVGLKTVFVTELAENPIDRTYEFGPYSVNVHGEATSYLWHFGDGETLGTDSQGHRYPQPGWTDVTHEYEESETFQAYVDVTFNGTFAIDGGAPQTLPTITIPGEENAVDVQVLQGDPRLTD